LVVFLSLIIIGMSHALRGWAILVAVLWVGLIGLTILRYLGLNWRLKEAADGDGQPAHHPANSGRGRHRGGRRPENESPTRQAPHHHPGGRHGLSLRLWRGEPAGRR